MTKVIDYEMMIECIRTEVKKALANERKLITISSGFITTQERELREMRISGMEQVQRVVEGIIIDCTIGEHKPPPKVEPPKKLKYYQR